MGSHRGESARSILPPDCRRTPPARSRDRALCARQPRDHQHSGDGMKLRRLVRGYVRAWIDRDSESAAIAEEMELHRELRARKLQDSGVASADALFAARRQFGNAAL